MAEPGLIMKFWRRRRPSGTPAAYRTEARGVWPHPSEVRYDFLAELPANLQEPGKLISVKPEVVAFCKAA